MRKDWQPEGLPIFCSGIERAAQLPNDKCVKTSPNHHATVRFYAELNDFLPSSRRSTAFVHEFDLHPSVKDMIESLGVPHTEVNLIVANGTRVDFSYSVQDGDRISVYPAFRSVDVSSLPQLRPPLKGCTFVLDTHLGRLATYLRLLGFDVNYDNQREDAELARITHGQARILLTRDVGLLKRSEVVYGYYVRATRARDQALEVVHRLDLSGKVSAFSRCLRCNSILVSVAKEAIIEHLEPKTRQHYDEFRTCPTCNRIYWAGSHYAHMQDFVRQILAL